MDAGFHSTVRTASTVAAMEWTLEWRQGHQLASVGLFALSSVYVAFQAASRGTAPEAWTAMLWLVYLFSGFTAVGRLFDRERSATRRYLQWTVDPLGLMLGKLLHAILTTTALSAIVLGAFVLSSAGLGGRPNLAGGAGRLARRFVHDHHLVFVTAVASQVQNGGSTGRHP